MEPVQQKPFLGARTYDILKKIVQFVLPALGSLYFGLSKIWGLPGGEEVVGSLALVATFGGVILGISKSQYDNNELRFVGETWLSPTDEGWKRVFNVTSDEIDPNRKEISFKVVDNQSP